MPHLTSERGKDLARARFASMSAQQRKALARKAHLASCAAAICERGDELSPHWRAKLAALVASWRDEGAA